MKEKKLKMKELENKRLTQSLVARSTKILSLHESDSMIDTDEKEFSHRRGQIDNNDDYCGPPKSVKPLNANHVYANEANNGYPFNTDKPNIDEAFYSPKSDADDGCELDRSIN